MRTRRRCRVCCRWFLPHPRAGDRQHVCSHPECQRERHRRSCTDWHVANSGFDRERRLRERLLSPAPVVTGPAGPLGADPLRQIAWLQTRDAVGLEVSVVVEETAKVLVQYVRDAVTSKQRVITKERGEVTNWGPRDAIVFGGPAP
jgi:hypothetical protein